MSRWDKHETMERCAEIYYGKLAVLETWEGTNMNVQVREHDYLVGLRAKIRVARQRIVYAARNCPVRNGKREIIEIDSETV